MKATHDRHGNVTISFNNQDACLRAPDELMPDGEWHHMQWLPCCSCGSLDSVELNVVSHRCQRCADHRDTCDDVDCKDPAHPHLNLKSYFE